MDKAQLDWEKIDNPIKKKIHEEKKRFLKRRKELLQSHPFDFENQATIVKERIRRDFKDAYDRMYPAYEGLVQLYGYSGPPVPSKDTQVQGQNPIDSCVFWVRETIKWMTAFLQRDQAFSLTVSIRSCISDVNWEQAINNLQEEKIRIKFRVPTDSFNSFSHVRLRGMSAFLLSKGFSGTPWSGTLQLPEYAFSYRSIGEPIRIDQTSMPLCHFGRIESRSNQNAPQICGVTSLKKY